MPSWRRVFTSEEAWIESKAGACPPEDGDEMNGLTGEPLRQWLRQLVEETVFDVVDDWPMPSPPPWPADDEDDEAPDE